MSTKHKKPKARRNLCTRGTVSIAGLPAGSSYGCFVVWPKRFSHNTDIPVAVLDVSDEAALIDFVAAAIRDDEMAYQCGASYTDHAMAALTALCVLPKRRGK